MEGAGVWPGPGNALLGPSGGGGSPRRAPRPGGRRLGRCLNAPSEQCGRRGGRKRTGLAGTDESAFEGAVKADAEEHTAELLQREWGGGGGGGGASNRAHVLGPLLCAASDVPIRT